MKRSGYLLQICATSPLLIRGPVGPHQLQSFPTRRSSDLISVIVDSTGWLTSDQRPGFHRRRDSNIELLIQAALGCCIQASMIIFTSCVARSHSHHLGPVKAHDFLYYIMRETRGSRCLLPAGWRSANAAATSKADAARSDAARKFPRQSESTPAIVGPNTWPTAKLTVMRATTRCSSRGVSSRAPMRPSVVKPMKVPPKKIAPRHAPAVDSSSTLMATPIASNTHARANARLVPRPDPTQVQKGTEGIAAEPNKIQIHGSSALMLGVWILF